MKDVLAAHKLCLLFKIDLDFFCETLLKLIELLKLFLIFLYDALVLVEFRQVVTSNIDLLITAYRADILIQCLLALNSLF